MTRYRPAPWTAADITDQSGRTHLVTGASDGLGLESTRALAASGARVLMACRNPRKAEAARGSLPAADRARTEVVPLDLADLESVHSLADQLAGERIDVLLANAGVMAIPEDRTPQGHEMQFGVNVLGHFALVTRLEAQLTDRVVWMGSLAHRMPGFDVTDLDWRRRPYRAFPAYAASKFACLALAYEQQRRFVRAGSTLRSQAAHPGYSATTLMSHSAHRGVTRLVSVGNRLRALSMTPEDGAASELYAATVADLPGGSYIGPSGPGQLVGPPRHVASSRESYDPALGARLWAACEEMTRR